ncbi:MAG: peptide deformylase [Spirochaetota bacterium]
MRLEIYPSDILSRTASLVPDPVRVAPYVDAMYELMKREGGIGLAAPQAGIGERFFVLGLPREGRRVFVNPEITERSRRRIQSEESCLSLPGVTVELDRWAWVEVHAWNERGEVVELRARGLLARAIQHELDHLNGVLCMDRIDRKRRERIVRRLEAHAHGTAAGHSS